jgi:hypothetical protein
MEIEMPVQRFIFPALVAFLLAFGSHSLLAQETGSEDLTMSNKWRLQFSGKANSDGTIVLKLTPKTGESYTAEIAVKNNTGENGVAKTVVKGLKAQLPKDLFHVERDDGEDVLIKKRFGKENFAVEIVSNTVDGVRINPDRE